jgi:hypothetical protein
MPTDRPDVATDDDGRMLIPRPGVAVGEWKVFLTCDPAAYPELTEAVGTVGVRLPAVTSNGERGPA